MSVADVLNRLFYNVAVMKFECFLQWSLFVLMLYGAIGAGVFRIAESLAGLPQKLYWWDGVNALAYILLWIAGFYFYPKNI